MSKSGFQGINLIPSLVLMYFFGVKETIAFSLLFFIIGDIYAAFHYRKSVDVSIFVVFIPWAIVGVAISGIFGMFVSEKVLTLVIVAIIIYLLIVTILQESRQKEGIVYAESSSPFVLLFYGVFAGVASTLANFGGTVIAIYLLKRKLLKRYIIGTGAFVFLSMNILKTGVFYFMWEAYTLETVLLAIGFWPWCIVGAVLGRKISDKIPEKLYRWVLITLISFSCLILLLKEYM